MIIANRNCTPRKTTMPKSQPHAESVVCNIPLSQITLHPDNPREAFDNIAELAHSLDAHGLIQRVVVRRIAENRFQLVAGARRYHAAKKAGWKTVPAEVKTLSDTAAIETMTVENLQRANLNCIERAKALQLLTASPADGGAGKTTNQAAAAAGRSPGWVQNQLRLLKLPADWQQRVASGKVSWQTGISVVPYVENEQIMHAIEAAFTGEPELLNNQREFPKRVVAIAEKFGELTQRTRHRKLIETANDDLASEQAKNVHDVAKSMGVSKQTIMQWQRQGAPLDKHNGEYDLVALAKWVKQRERDKQLARADAARRATPVRVGTTPKRNADKRLLRDEDVVDLLAPYEDSVDDLKAIRRRCDALLIVAQRKTK